MVRGGWRPVAACVGQRRQPEVRGLPSTMPVAGRAGSGSPWVPPAARGCLTLTYCTQRSLWIAFGRKVIVNRERAVVRASPNSPVDRSRGTRRNRPAARLPHRAGHAANGSRSTSTHGAWSPRQRPEAATASCSRARSGVQGAACSPLGAARIRPLTQEMSSAYSVSRRR